MSTPAPAASADLRHGPFDVLTMGRVSVDLYPEQSGVPLAEVASFTKFLGGSATNVAVAAARYERRTAVITKVGDDGFGAFVRSALRRFGVDDRYVGTDPVLRTPIVFCELFPPDRFPILFYREPKAPDINLWPGEIDVEAVRGCRIFWTTGTGLSDEPSRTATLGALEARGRRGITIHDLDFRPSLWAAPEQVGEYQRVALAHATVAIGNREEVAGAVGGGGGPEAMAARLLALGPEIAFVKLGAQGVLAAWQGGMSRVPAVRVPVVNGLGAGDAFGGAVCHGLLARWDPTSIAHFAAAAGAHVAARLACADAMPSESEVRELMGAAAPEPGTDS